MLRIRAIVLFILLALGLAACASEARPTGAATAPLTPAANSRSAADLGPAASIPDAAGDSASAISTSRAAVSVNVGVSVGADASSVSSASSTSSSIVSVSVTNGSGAVSRTISLDREGRVKIRVTSNGDVAPVIDVELSP